MKIFLKNFFRLSSLLIMIFLVLSCFFGWTVAMGGLDFHLTPHPSSSSPQFLVPLPLHDVPDAPPLNPDELDLFKNEEFDQILNEILQNGDDPFDDDFDLEAFMDQLDVDYFAEFVPETAMQIPDNSQQYHLDQIAFQDLLESTEFQYSFYPTHNDDHQVNEEEARTAHQEFIGQLKSDPQKFNEFKDKMNHYQSAKLEKLKQDPEKYAQYLQKKRAYNAKYLEELKSNSQEYAEYLAKKSAYQASKLERLKSDPEKYSKFLKMQRNREAAHRARQQSDPEKHAQFLEKQRAKRTAFNERLKANPVKLAEFRKKKKAQETAKMKQNPQKHAQFLANNRARQAARKAKIKADPVMHAEFLAKKRAQYAAGRAKKKARTESPQTEKSKQ